jgi:hypothetical protein
VSGLSSSNMVEQHEGMSERIEITPAGQHAVTVTLHGAGAATSHRVVVPPALTSDLGLGPEDDIRLVRASFEFLLEREPATSILPRFELDVIGRYFPEYMDTMRQRLGREA